MIAYLIGLSVSACANLLSLQQKIVSENNPLNVTAKGCGCLSQHSALTSSPMYLIPKYMDLFLPCKANLDFYTAMISVSQHNLSKTSVFALCGEQNDLSYLGIWIMVAFWVQWLEVADKKCYYCLFISSFYGKHKPSLYSLIAYNSDTTNNSKH